MFNEAKVQVRFLRLKGSDAFGNGLKRNRGDIERLALAVCYRLFVRLRVVLVHTSIGYRTCAGSIVKWLDILALGLLIEKTTALWAESQVFLP